MLTQFDLLLNRIFKDLQKAKSADDKYKQSLCFYELNKNYHNHFFAIAQHYLKNKSEADDVVQEFYVRLLKHIDSYKSSLRAYNWAVQIVKNAAFDLNKQTKNVISTEGMEDFFPCQNNFLDRLLDKIELNNACNKLTKKEKQLFYYRLVERLTYREIAEKFGIVHSTVSEQTQKLLNTLQNNLKN